ncbi:NAD(P)H-binding protein [Streptomyces beijiangensis]|uniref:NAD(P)H-binding protein n=1 Tax=Streptomyces beijiangensis TaxID=163361 RepID=A0A939FD92_9ACTN|nr:NAD(P)H-binding protein [Streptomyces beijiangensis]MBO0516508.1 NAD(P)H-binding protein [Streptomyces beijiangensis]
MILVTGATGNVGSEVVRILTAAGEEVRPFSRATGGELNDPKSVASQLDGVSAVFLLPGFENFAATLAEIRAAGVERVVMLSSSSVPGGDLKNAVSRYMIESEVTVRESGLPWTFLRPNAFMSNTLRWLPQLRAGDVVRDAFPSVRVATIDPYDIAAIAALALTGPEYEGHAFALSGPDSLLPADRLRILGEVLGRDLTFVGLSDDEARVEMEAAMPQQYVDAFFSFYVEGTLDESPVLQTVKNLTGREPRSFRQWAENRAEAFAR